LICTSEERWRKDMKSTLRGHIRNLVNESQSKSRKNQLFSTFALFSW
jgi:hypothetical protein